MRVAALTSGHVVPSTRFRVRQHILPLEEKKIFVKEFAPLEDKYSPPPQDFFTKMREKGKDPYLKWKQIKKRKRLPSVILSYFFDITWLERILIPEMLSYELKTKKPLVFDLDDAIWLGEGKGFTAEIVKKATMVFAGNQYLADYCSQYSNNVHIIPTAVNVLPQKNTYQRNNEKEKIIIGWIGTSSNLQFLKMIFPELKIILEKNKHVSILICSDKSPESTELPFEFLKWSIDAEKIFFDKTDIGIMPLEDSEWIKGKCSYKMLQYLGNGIPAVVSGVGMNVQVANELDINVCANSKDEWIAKIELSIADKNYYNMVSKRGMELIEEKYSVKVVSTKIAELFLSLV